MDKVGSTDQNKFWRELKSWVAIILIALGLKSTVIASYMVPTGSMENTIMTGDFLIGNKYLFGARTPDWIGIPYTRTGFNIPSFRLPSFTKPEQGDILIFKFPKDKHLRYVKRCIAGPGQTLEIKKRKLFVDGKKYPLPPKGKFVRDKIIDKDYSQQNVFSSSPANIDNFGPLYVPEEGDTLTPESTPKHVLRNVLGLSGHDFTIENDHMIIEGAKKEKYITKQNYFFMMGDNRDNSLDSRYWGFVSSELILGKPLFVFMSWDKSKPLFQIDEKIRWERIGNVVN